ncbi:MAG: hypothetical protein GX639_07925 [Fibrobacter sp.]|nr:hypothetical protein [Fibrobacter sp.]
MTRKTIDTSWYCDPLFDLKLGGYPTDKVHRSALEMGVLFYLLCNESDQLIIDFTMPQSFIDYMRSKGIPPPASIINRSQKNPLQSVTGTAWGWTTATEDVFSRCNAICNKPDTAIISRINNRKFCHELGLHYGLGVEGSCFCSTIDDFNRFRQSSDLTYPLVIKPAFGGSGFGFKRLVSEADFSDSYELVKEYCRHGGFVIERWCNRICDLSTNCLIHQDGTVEYVRYQRLFSNSFGAFFGIYCGPADPVLDKWKSGLQHASSIVISEMIKAGYYGPAGFDSFVYDTGYGYQRLAPIIEINGRYVMSHIARSVRSRIAPEKHCLMRMISKKRCKLPDSYDVIAEKLGETMNKLCILTPLRVYHNTQWLQPSRMALFLYDDSEDGLFDLDKKVVSLLTNE